MDEKEFVVKGVVYDPISKGIIPGRIVIVAGRIDRIEPDENITSPIILPGFVDSHIHIESSMLIPTEFSKMAAKHGTVAVVADPHEIANVAGVDGIDFMIRDAKNAEIKFFFGAPSCVPASPFDDCYTVIDSAEIANLVRRDDIYFLGEMMNFPGVINSNQDVLKKIQIALDYKKPVDGHAPGLSSDSLKKYVAAGISTDHECFTEEEAIEKLNLGVKILIREGSAAKNFSTLHALISKYPHSIMLCTDDCHPEDLINGHINIQVKRSLVLGHKIFDVLQVTSVNPVKHYKLDVGLLQVGDRADFIVVDNLSNLNIKANFINGVDVLENISSHSVTMELLPEYIFSASIKLQNLRVAAKNDIIKVIEVIEGELVTNSLECPAKVVDGEVVSDIDNDILKIVIVNRYKRDQSFVGFIKGFGLKKGAIAESIAHDSHHVIAVGVEDESIFAAIDYIIKNRGGVCYFDDTIISGLSLPVYGLMGIDSADIIASKYETINRKVIDEGCTLKSPFMTLSFMALSVIPKLKITPKGLFEGVLFTETDLFFK